jgi:hypothetical protein
MNQIRIIFFRYFTAGIYLKLIVEIQKYFYVLMYVYHFSISTFHFEEIQRKTKGIRYY